MKGPSFLKQQQRRCTLENAAADDRLEEGLDASAALQSSFTWPVA